MDALTTLSESELSQRLTEAQDALHRLATGAREVRVGDRRVAYAESAELERYIASLYAALRQKQSGIGRRPVVPVF